MSFPEFLFCRCTVADMFDQLTVCTVFVYQYIRVSVNASPPLCPFLSVFFACLYLQSTCLQMLSLPILFSHTSSALRF